MENYLKKDLFKVLVLLVVIVLILAGLTILDNKTGILTNIAAKYFKF
ncbi:MAG: hypothetical protein NTZ18_00085 [Candidatus Komeilibacteria bacterium]|nr:hypothetical protein [Candidatus Komeilibacteria bacterium]